MVALRVGSLKATVTARAAPGERVRGWSCQYPRGVRAPVESQAREEGRGGGVNRVFCIMDERGTRGRERSLLFWVT